MRKALSRALRSTAFGASRIKRLSAEWGMIRVYLLRSTLVFCVPIARWSIGRQSAFNLSLAFLHDVAPMGPERLLIYTHIVFWRSQYVTGAEGVCIGVGTGVLCTIYGGLLGGVGVANAGAIRD